MTGLTKDTFNYASAPGYKLSPLDRADVEVMKALYRHVKETMPSGQETYIYEPQDRVINLSLAGQGHIIAARCEQTGTLAGAAIIAYPSATNANMGLAKPIQSEFESVSVFRSYVVHPAHRKKGLGEALARSWLDMSALQGRHLCLTEVHPDNDASKNVFYRCGLQLFENAVHPFDQENVMELMVNLRDQNNLVNVFVPR